MKVIASDGQHVGTVDCLKGENLVLTKSDPASDGRHHALPLDWVSNIDGDRVRLTKTSEQVRSNWFDAEITDGQNGSKAVCP